VETRIFLAGATGVIGRRLVPLLSDAGYAVFGTTRREAKAELLKRAGATPVVLDVFDAPALSAALSEIRPEIVIHQLTDLPAGLDPSCMDEAIPRNARVRSEGTRNLVSASIASGARRLIAQSLAWTYAPGPEPHGEDDLLDTQAEGLWGITIDGVVALERLTLLSPPLEGIVLRYGQLYGPGTGKDGPHGAVPLHVDAAAQAALLAIDRGAPGAFNIAEPNEVVRIDKARQELGWDPGFRLNDS
jgi:nucleoside-diphosphate-sugar epimerase